MGVLAQVVESEIATSPTAPRNDRITDYIEISISFFRDADFSLNSCTEQYSTGTTSIVSIFSVIGPNDGIAIRTMTSEPRPVEVRIGRRANTNGIFCFRVVKAIRHCKQKSGPRINGHFLMEKGIRW